MTENPPIIRLEKVSKSFDAVTVLREVDLDIHQGQTTVIIGPSGCGKSVLLKHIIGLLRPDSGAVYFKGERLNDLTERKLAPVRRQMGFLFQASALFDSMTVEENVCFPLDEHGIGKRDTRIERCREMLALVGLDGLQDRLPQELSGGQQKRVALARAIVQQPEVILYDEPTTGLDPVRSDVINELILKLQRVLGTTAVVVTHDLNSARKVGDRIVMLHSGRLILDVHPDELDRAEDEVVLRFVRGQADKEALAELETGHLVRRNGAVEPAREKGNE